MGEIRHRLSVHLEIDGNGRAAQLGMRGGGCVRVRQAPDSRNVSSQFQNSAIIYLVEHERDFQATRADCAAIENHYIGGEWRKKKPSFRAHPFSGIREQTPTYLPRKRGR